MYFKKKINRGLGGRTELGAKQKEQEMVILDCTRNVLGSTYHKTERKENSIK